MIAYPDETHGLGDAFRQCAQSRAQVSLGQRVIPAAVAAGDAEGDDLRTIRRAAPAEQACRQRHLMLLRTHRRIIALSRGMHVAGQGCRMPKAVDVVRHLWKNPEAIEEKAFADGDLPFDAEPAGEVAVRLHPPPAHECPASCRDMLPDAREKRGVGALDLPIAPGLAGGKDELREAVQQLAHRAARCQHLIQPRLPGPEPYRIDMGIGDNVYRDRWCHEDLRDSGFRILRLRLLERQRLPRLIKFRLYYARAHRVYPCMSAFVHVHSCLSGRPLNPKS